MAENWFDKVLSYADENVRQNPDKGRGGLWSILDAVVYNDNPLVRGVGGLFAANPLALPLQKKAWDAAGTGLNFVMGNSDAPLSESVVAAETMARGGKWGDEQRQSYKQAAQANAVVPGATGFIAPVVAGMWASERAWDYGVNRPLGTAALVTDPDSTLFKDQPIQAIDAEGNPIVYNKGGAGFQISDISDAWNRTESVTAGQAAAANNLINAPAIGGIAPIINILGGTQNYDPWSDSDMQAAQDNPWYVAVTGGIDAGLQLAVPPMLRAGRIAGMQKLGLTNTVRSAEDLAKFRADFESHTPETPNAWGTLVDNIAAQSNPAKIRANQVVANNVGADKGRLSEILAETTDRSTVNEILLANMGDVDAIRALADAAPDYVWRLGEVDNIIKANAANGVPFRPTGEALNRVNQVFDSALARDRYFGTLREELTTPRGKIRETLPDGTTRLVDTDEAIKVNSTWRPTDSLIVEKIRTKANEIGYAVRQSDYSEMPQWVRQTLSGPKGSIVTSRLQWAGSRSPLGHVSNSGARPDEKLIEFNAQMDSLPELRGTRTLNINGRDVPAWQWRQEWESRILNARDSELPDLWNQMEEEVIDIMADTFGVDRGAAREVANNFRTRIGDEMQYLRDSNGYLFDEQAGRIVVDPKTARQMLNSFQTMPLADIRAHIIREKNMLNRVPSMGQAGLIALYDGVQKVFRTDVLFRPGYMGKNSMVEPLISRFLAHGTILADEGLWSTFGNYSANWSRRFRRIAYYAQLHKLMDSSLRTGADKAKIQKLITQRDDLQKVLDSAVAEQDAWNRPGNWPGLDGLHGEQLRGILFDTQQKMNQVEAMLDDAMPEWRQVVEPATLTDLSEKLAEYRALVGQNPEYLRALETRAGDIETQARGRVQSPRQIAEGALADLEGRLADLERRQEFLSGEYGPRTDVTGVGVAEAGAQRPPRADMTPEEIAKWEAENPSAGSGSGKQVPLEGGSNKDVARGRDYQGVAVQRQIDSLREQIEDVRAVIDEADDFVEPRYTVNEKKELDRIYATLERVREDAVDTSRWEYLREPLEQIQWMRAEYPNVNNYVADIQGGLGPERTVVGYVSVSTLKQMHGNPRSVMKFDEMGNWDGSKVTDPVVVLYNPETRQMWLGEGNHRVELAGNNLKPYIPTRVVRTGATPGEGVTPITVSREMPFERVPSDMHPAYLFDDNQVLDNLEVWSARADYRAAMEADEVTATIVAKIDELQAEYNKIIAHKESFDPSDNMAAIQMFEDAMEDLQFQIDEIAIPLRATEGEAASKLGRLGSAGYAGSGSGNMTVTIGGKKIVVPAAFSEEGEHLFGSGYRAEASAQQTNRLTYDPSTRADFETGRWQRSNGPQELTPDNELYWPTLEYVGNRYFRDDFLIQKYLSGWSREQIAIWLRTEEGLAYQRGMGKDYLVPREGWDPIKSRNGAIDAPTGTDAPEVTNIRGRGQKPVTGAEPTSPVSRETSGNPPAATHVLNQSTTELDEVLRLVDQYFPDKAVQRRLAQGEMTANELKAMLGGRDDLSRISGDSLSYHPFSAQRIMGAVNKVLDKVWQWIATMPEDRIARWPFYQHEFRNQMTKRMEILAQQGIDVSDLRQSNALRQASHRASLEQLEKTFYNIRRYSTPVYASRFLMTFPGAFFNSIYRYGRFAMREPERLWQVGMIEHAILKHGLINEDGERVEDIRQAKYFLVPGTSGDHDPGVKIPLSSIYSLGVDFPSLGVGLTTTASLIQGQDAAFSDGLRKTVGDAVFEEMFPYGISDNPLQSLAGSYQRDLWVWWNGVRGENDVNLNRTMIQFYDYDMYEWEKGGREGPIPTLEDAAEKAGAFYGQQAVTKFMSPTAVVKPIPGQYLRDGWTDLMEKHGGDTAAAREEYLKLYGDEAYLFTVSGNKREAYIPSTQVAYDIIWKQFPDLARDLVKDNPDDPSMVGLLAYGTGGEYSPEISDWMRNNPLPGDTEPVLATMTLEEYENHTLVSHGFELKNKAQTRYNADKLRLMDLRDNAPSEREKQQYRDLLNGLDIDYADYMQRLENSNTPFRLANNGSSDQADKATAYLEKIVSDEEFMAGPGNTPAWEKIEWFLRQNARAREQYDALTDNEEKAAFKSDYTNWILDRYVDGDPDFEALWNRYFSGEWQTTRMRLEEAS